MRLLDHVDSKNVDADRLHPRLHHYENEAVAIELEQCEDALHFLYASTIAQTARRFLAGFPGTCLYAVKANPHPAVVIQLWRSGVRQFEVASIREIEFLSKLLPEARLFFMHPVKSRNAIRRAYALGVRHFAFDSLDELKKIREETANAEDLCLHLRLTVSQYGSAYPLDAKFGATMVEAPLLLAHARQFARKLGVTFHVGSQCLELDAYSDAIRTIAKMREGCGIEMDMIDVGGGFPVTYPDMAPLPIEQYFDRIREALVENGFDRLEVYCEPGRAMIAEGAAVAVRVEMRRGQSLYLNDGTYGSLFDAGHPGWCYPVELYRAGRSPIEEETDELFQFYGPTCDSIDKMTGPFSLPGDVCEGDWIIFRNIGAYGYTMQTRFNGFYSETMVAIDRPVAAGTVLATE